MRARYSAYAKVETDFIISSTHPDHRSGIDHAATRKWAEKSAWHGLEIVSTAKGGETDTEGEVEFKAHYTEDGVKRSLHEKARFQKKDGAWYYVEGEIQRPAPFRREEPKVGRNDPCPCGSGKKFKKCCGK